MAWSFPFRVLRRAGSPRTGGDTHSLQGHIASPSAHPQYLKKGDSVGGANLAEHEANPKAHQQHYLRRAELMTTLSQYLDFQSKNLYDGTSSVDSTYNVIATQAALYEMFSKENVQNVIPSIFVRERIVGTADGLRNILNEEINANTAADKKFVPSWDLFKQVWAFFASLKNGINNDDIGDNPLADLFALKNHTHANYALKQHYHRNWNELVNERGQIPAEANHDHDDRYVLKGEESDGDGLSPLANVGIYPKAYHQLDDDTELNGRCAHGMFTYHMNDSHIVSGLPPSIASAIEATFAQSGDPAHIASTKSTLTVAATVHVIESDDDAFSFDGFSYSDYIAEDPVSSHGSRVVTQLLTVNPSIPSAKRSGESDAIKNAVIGYKSGLRGCFWRSGYNLETAWYIESILNSVLGQTVSEFFINASGETEASESTDLRISTAKRIADVFNNAFRSSDNIPTGLSIGYFRYPSDTVVRSDNTGTAFAIKRDNGSIDFAKDVLAHDSCSWVLPGTLVQDNSITLANDGTDNMLYKNLVVGTTADRFLSYQTYFTVQTVYRQADNEGIITGYSGYLLRSSGNDGTAVYTPITGNYSGKQVASSEVEERQGAPSYVDPGSVLLKLITPASGTAEANYDYFTKEQSEDVYGMPTFTPLTISAGAVLPENAYVREIVVANGSTPESTHYVWSKRPVRKYNASTGEGEIFDGSKTYYTFANGTFRPTTVSPVYGIDYISGEQAQVVSAPSTVFVDYDIFTASVEMSQIDDTSVRDYALDSIYTRGLFFRTHDITTSGNDNYLAPVAGKIYFRPTAGSVFEIVDTSASNISADDVYECIDVETMFNIWCAIHKLITTGSDVHSREDNKNILYYLTDTGGLITWDPWEQIITASTPGQVEAMNAMSVTETPVTGGGSRAELTFEGNKVITDTTLASYLSSNNVITSANLASALSGAGVITSSNLGTALDNLAPSGNTAGYVKFTITNGRLVFNDGTDDVTIANFTDINSGSGGGSSTVLTKLSIDSTHGWLMYTGSDNTPARVAMYSDIEIASRISETNDHKLTFTDSTNAAHTIAFTSDLHSHSNKTILDKFSESSNKLQYGATGAKKNVILAGDLETAEKLTHEYEYTEVDTATVSTPDANATYYVDGAGDTKVLAANDGHPSSFASGTTYYTRTSVIIKLDGLPLSGTTGSGTAEFVEEEINDSRTTSGGYWEIMTLTDMDVEKLSYDVIMKVAKTGGYDIIPNPIANVAASTTYSPVYVPATALLVCDMTTKVLKMRVPVEWMNLHGHSDSASYSLIIRAHQTAQ